ncbi:MAG TPA: hypothetical protein VHE81_19520 [Lacipirellulaceae bacterium]|nr:hypothetical protein [Lacipirellulaceae bacterium]
MHFVARRRHLLIAVFVLSQVAAASAQTAPPQPVAAPQGASAPVAQQQQQLIAQIPPGFQLNALQQAQLDQMLDAWQKASRQILTFQCDFERWEYNVAFGPQNKNLPLNKNKGSLSYQKPDKGSFEITEVNTFQLMPAKPGDQSGVQKGDWVKQPDAIGDHWVCDGKAVYQYRPDLKQLVEHPIPPQFQGQGIVDGPLPFLFGADTAKLKERYWMRIDNQAGQNPNQVWLVAMPKHQQQAADFSEVDVILDRQKLLPRYMQVWMPNRSHDVYIFDIDNADVNGLFNRVKAALFSRPSIPHGWKLVVQETPVAQAAPPVQPVQPRR